MVYPIDLFWFCIQNHISLERMQVTVFIVFFITISPSKTTNFEMELDSIGLFWSPSSKCRIPFHMQQLSVPSTLTNSERISETNYPQLLIYRQNQDNLQFHSKSRHLGTALTVSKLLLEMSNFIHQ